MFIIFTINLINLRQLLTAFFFFHFFKPHREGNEKKKIKCNSNIETATKKY